MLLDVIGHPNKELVEKIRSEFGLNERRVKEAVQLLRDWIELQPHLPKEIDDGRLERWLIRCKNSIEKVKKSLDMYYTLRTNIPDIMTGWDTEADWFRSVSSYVYYLPMPQLTPDCDRVTIFAMQTADSSNFNCTHFIKLMQMLTEIRISEDYCRSDIIIADYANVTAGHLTKVTPSLLKKYELCVQNGYNVRLKAFHVINNTSIIDTFLAMAKRLWKSKLAERIITHGNDLTKLFEQVPKEILPTEYGGNSGSIQENWDLWKKKLQTYRNIFLERESYRSDESKRPGEPIRSSDLLGFEGTFRQLDVD